MPFSLNLYALIPLLTLLQGFIFATLLILRLLAIAFECGFNSKTTFNRAVKKATNRMPSEFIVKN